MQHKRHTRRLKETPTEPSIEVSLSAQPRRGNRLLLVLSVGMFLIWFMIMVLLALNA
jgi:hypothetical protein